MGYLMRFIGPLTIATTISLVGLSLFKMTGEFAGIVILALFMYGQIFSKINLIEWYIYYRDYDVLCFRTTLRIC